MKIGLIDVDGHNYPNLALMKISAWHKQNGDSVEWCMALDSYDRVYKAKVFDETYTEDDCSCVQAKEIVKGGTGYFRKKHDQNRKVYHEIYRNGQWENVGAESIVVRENETYMAELPDDIEHIYPDYSLYPTLTEQTAFGCLTRGCPRGCSFCVVGAKEGLCSVKVADLNEFWDGQKNIELLDPNLLACRDHMSLLKQLEQSKARVNFNQGLDIRMITPQNIEMLNQIKVKNIHFAWDNPKDKLEKRFEQYASLAKHKPTGEYATVYCLTNYGSTMEENLYRIYALRDMGYRPYVMVYDKPNAPQEIRRLQRWCNNIFIFKSCKRFEDYDPRKG